MSRAVALLRVRLRLRARVRVRVKVRPLGKIAPHLAPKPSHGLGLRLAHLL